MHIAPLIKDLAVILGVAGLATYIFKVIRQPVVLGYIAAGLLVGPYTPSILSVVDLESIKIWAELGVILLMFNLGLEFSFPRLVRLGPSAGFTGLLQIFAMVISGYFMGKIFGWNRIDCIFLGCTISVSSTTIIIKALDEMNLKDRKFAELVFGILIVEDLASIVMMVALASFATQASFDFASIAQTGGNLLFIVSIWVIFGIFLLPRLVTKVAAKGNDEMLIVVSLALCLGLVTIAAKLDYSVALGAFIMGSILSESGPVKRIEHLLMPLKDVFGAIFFVSVGMMLDPAVIMNNFGMVFWVSLLIIVGKVLSVTIGALLTGQNISNAIQTGFSMAQVGEFSFIIASLGLSLGVINDQIYPIIVAASLVTTFTTPYLIKISGPFAHKVEASLPAHYISAFDRYRNWFVRQSANAENKQEIARGVMRLLGHGIVVTALFILAAKHVTKWLMIYIANPNLAHLLSWCIAMIFCSPSLWAMMSAFRPQGKGARMPLPALVSLAGVFVFIMLLSAEFFSGWISLSLFLVIFVVFFIIFRNRVKSISLHLEKQFMQGLKKADDAPHSLQMAGALVPWDAHLVPLVVPATSKALGMTLESLKLREKYGVNIVAINRGDVQIVAPGAMERVFPFDELLCFASDDEIDSFKRDFFQERPEAEGQGTPNEFSLRQINVTAGHWPDGLSIRDAAFSSEYSCIVVGVERGERRIKSPKSDFIIQPDDAIWVIVDSKNIKKLNERLNK